jgi:polyferredoxin
MIKESIKNIEHRVGKDECKDTGMAFVLIFLILHIFSGYNSISIFFAFITLILTMTYPLILKKLSVFWLAFSQLIGTVASKIILTILFFAIVTPMGVLRRLIGKDDLKLTEFKKSEASAFDDRNYTFGPKDFENPF